MPGTQASLEVLMRARWLLASLLLCLSGAGEIYAAVEVIDAHARYPEGPLWDQGRLLYVEYAGDGIKLWDGKEAKIYWRKDHCGASGLIHFHDHILVACYDGNTLVELDARGKELRTISKDSSGKPFAGPNDFSTDGHGGIYFSASGVYDIKAPITGTVLHMSADGQDIREVADTIHYSNGLTLSNDGRHLLVAEMLASRILSFPILATGGLGPRVVWARLQDLAPPTAHEDAYNGPDGLK
jgi:sugar lactone lactonase YvrE